MQAEQIQVSLTPALYRQFTRLKTQGQFHNDHDLIQACFQSLEREWERNSRLPIMGRPAQEPFMRKPALGLEDYET